MGKRSLYLVAVLTVLATRGFAAGLDDEIALVHGMRERRLFDLAQLHCADLLRDPSFSSIERVKVTVERIRCYAEHALHVPPKDRKSLWDKARSVAAEFEQVDPRNSRLVLVRVQDALTLLAQGELLRHETEVAADPLQSRAAALETIRAAVRLLDAISSGLEKEIPARQQESATNGQLSLDELYSLRNHIWYQLARAYRNRGLCYEATSDDRLAALSQVVKQNDELLIQLADEDALCWVVELERISALRSLGDLVAARQRLEFVATSPVEGKTRVLLEVERIRLLLAEDHLEEALEWFSRPEQPQRSAALDFVRLECYLIQWQAVDAAVESSAVDEWHQRSLALVQSIESTYGSYWGRRANLLLIRYAGTMENSSSIAVLARSADEMYRRGDLAAAARTYLEAADRWVREGDADAAFKSLSKAALVEEARGEFRTAIQIMRDASCGYPDQAQASSAHLYAVQLAIREARQDVQFLSTYEVLLAEHLKLWDRAASANQVRVWQALVHESRQEWLQAAAAYGAVRPSSSLFAKALEGAGTCWENALRGLSQPRQQAVPEALAAAEYFEGVVAQLKQEEATRFTQLARFCQFQAAKCRLDHAGTGAAAAELLLLQALGDVTKDEVSWRSEALAMLVVALAAQPGREAEAWQRLKSMVQASTAERFSLAVALARIRQQASLNDRPQIARLELQTLNALEKNAAQLSPPQLLTLARMRTQALASFKDRDFAAAQLRPLAVAHPKDLEIQVAWAEFLLTAGEKELLVEALECWRLISSRTKKNSPIWFRAKYSIALTYFRLGQKSEASQRLRYLQATTDLSKTPLEEAILALLKECLP